MLALTAAEISTGVASPSETCFPHVADGVESIRADFLAHEFRETFDIVLCLL